MSIEQQQLRSETGALFVVSDTQLRYLKPARLDDSLSVSVALRACGRASMSFFQQAKRGEELLAEGEIRIGCVDAASFKPRRIPSAVLERLHT
jgi:acyl-CoA thioester hydrolase